MAKKKAAKKQTKKVTKKPARKSAAKAVRKSAKKSSRSAGSMETVKPQFVDVTEVMKESVVTAPPPASEPKPEVVTLTSAEAQVKHDEFTAALKEEPPKRGFWARLFGKK